MKTIQEKAKDLELKLRSIYKTLDIKNKEMISLEKLEDDLYEAHNISHSLYEDLKKI